MNVGNDGILRRFRDHSVCSLDKLKSCFVEYVNCGDFNNCDDINDMTDNLMGRMLQIYNACCPIRCKFIHTSSITKPWLNSNLKSIIKIKHDYFRRYRRGIIPFSIYNSIKNQVTCTLRKAKREFFLMKFSQSKSCKDSWKILNTILNKHKKRSKDITLKLENELVSTPNIVASAFSEYFSNITDEIEGSIPQSDVDPLPYLDTLTANQSMFACPTTTDEVHKVIMSLKSRGAPIDEIPTFIFKKISPIVSPLIAELFNASLLVGLYPDSFKLSRVVPIFKKGSPQLVSNYRPISTISVFSKIFETLMARRLNVYLDNFSIMAPSQFGFRSKKCTADAICEYLDFVYTAIDERCYTNCIFLDFSKAFDTVNHVVLIRKLDRYGIRGPVNDWFKSYLNNRRQYISVNGVVSNLSVIRRGVPQGSVLGPLLFIIYINDLYKSCSKIRMVHYADDTTLFHKGKSMDTLIHETNTELRGLEEWLYANRLSLNIEKTKCMNISKRPVDTHLSVMIGNTVIENVDAVNFLGVVVDKNLSFREQGMNVISRLSRSLGILRKVSNYVPNYIKLKIYYSHFYCHLTFALIIWGNVSKVIDGKIVKLQSKAVSLLDERNNEDKFITYRLLKFCNIYKMFCLVKLFNVIHGSHNHFLNRIEAVGVRHGYSSRSISNESMTNIFCRTSCSQNNFLFDAINYWNSTPLHIRKSTHVMKFKKCLKYYLLCSQNN